MSDYENVTIIIEDDGDLSESDRRGYAEVIGSAYEVHLQRETVRNGLWKQYTASDQAQQIKIKADRVNHTLELIRTRGEDLAISDLESATVEELYDIINYSVFAVRQLKGIA